MCIGAAAFHQIHHKLRQPSSCSGVCGRIPISQFEQHRSTEAMIDWHLFNICAILFLLGTEVFVLNLLWYPKVSYIFCVPFDVLLSRTESTLQISKCGSRSVPPNLVRHASLVQIRIRKARSLAGPLAKCFAASVKSNLSRANQFAPCCVNLIPNLILSSVQSNRCFFGFHHRIKTKV